MKREILFRGKQIDNGEWTEGNFVKDGKPDEREFYIQTIPTFEENFGTLFEIESNSIGQFTGKCDKNGKKIFEGDIIWDYAEEEYLVILWCQKLGRFVRSETVDVNKGLWYSFNDIFEEEGCEVKGNIHDNPELLEGNCGN